MATKKLSKSNVINDQTQTLQTFDLLDLHQDTQEKACSSNASKDFHLFYVGRDAIGVRPGVRPHYSSRANGRDESANPEFPGRTGQRPWWSSRSRRSPPARSRSCFSNAMCLPASSRRRSRSAISLGPNRPSAM